jgi:hypothetical protein|tara:strand:- start:840 stop:1193 length:354 start_codon:yes stop_codon:yes gene_type:complete
MRINVRKDFSKAPGPRYKEEGKNSGELLRETILAPQLRKALESGSKLIIDLDGTAGFGTSFLEESFGGLIREDKFNYKDIKNIIEFISKEDPYLIEEIEEYLLDAKEEAQENRQAPA